MWRNIQYRDFDGFRAIHGFLENIDGYWKTKKQYETIVTTLIDALISDPGFRSTFLAYGGGYIKATVSKEGRLVAYWDVDNVKHDIVYDRR